MRAYIATSDGVPLAVGTLLSAGLLCGCSSRGDVSLARVEVDRWSWDSLRVEMEVTFAETFKRSKDLVPDSTTSKLYDASYALLYAGVGPHVHVPDATLGSRENLMLEVCAHVEGLAVCEQRKISTSPKRLRWNTRLAYPQLGMVERGTYDFGFRVERQQFGSDGWEPMPDGVPLETFLIASFQDRDETKMRIPIGSDPGAFDLSRQPNFPEYEFLLTRALSREGEVSVRFGLFAGLREAPVEVARLERKIRRKDDAERELEVESFVQQAAERILSSHLPYERAYVYVGAWTFSESTGSYSIPVRLHWGASRRSLIRLDGVLRVSEDGEGAVFERARTSRRSTHGPSGADALNVTALGNLDPPASEPAPEEGAEALAFL